MPASLVPKEQDIENSRKKVRVLVADDDPGYVRAIQASLKAEGYQVLVARDGPTAVEDTASRGPDLVVLGSGITRLDGYEVCKRIREFSAVPIILLVSLVGSAYRIKGLCVGADHCLTKPFYIPELLARIEAVLRRVEICERKGYQFVFQADGTRDEADQRLSAQG